METGCLLRNTHLLTMSSAKNNKKRGFGFEREIVHAARAHDLGCVRAWSSNGLSLGEGEAVDNLLEAKFGGCKQTGREGYLRIQAKRHKKVAAKFKIPEGSDMVVFREDHGKPMAILPLDVLLKVIREQIGDRDDEQT